MMLCAVRGAVKDVFTDTDTALLVAVVLMIQPKDGSDEGNLTDVTDPP